MPESYVEPVALLNVNLSVRSHRTRWGAMSASPTTSLAGSPSSGAIPLLPGRQPIAWVVVAAGWTLVGLGYFASLASEAAPPEDPTVHWTRLLALGLGTG